MADEFSSVSSPCLNAPIDRAGAASCGIWRAKFLVGTGLSRRPVGMFGR